MKCLRCNKEIDKGDIFCGYCGINQEKYKAYLARVSKKVHKDSDKEYNKNIKVAEKNLSKLEESRKEEIERIEDSRWTSIGDKDFAYNETEGKILIKDSTYLFTDIEGAEIIKKESVRIVSNTVENTKTKSKKHMSVGGALAGTLIAPGVGTIVGGAALGKKTSEGNNTSTTTTSEIPTCSYIGVKAKLKGFPTELALLSSTVDQRTDIYNNTIEKAQAIVDKLKELSAKKVPKNFLKPEEEQSVLKIDEEIKKAKQELKAAKENKPTYEIPEKYL